MSDPSTLVVVPGNQLFEPTLLRTALDEHGIDIERTVVFMAEDHGACTYVRHHKHKLVLILTAMRAHARALRSAGFTVHYDRLDHLAGNPAYTATLARACEKHGARELVHFEIQDKPFERKMARFAERHGLHHTVLPSPMFLTSRHDFACWRAGRRQPRMADFYKWQRQRLDVLMADDGTPRGGRWSFDADNRKALPHARPVPRLPEFPGRQELEDVKKLVERRFTDHPGNTNNFYLPTTRKQAEAWLRDFLEQRFTCFGDYEDALTTRSDAVFHSVLSPLLNIGLLTPGEVVEAALSFGRRERIAMNNIEGFVRQIIGWREFMFGIYQTDSERLMNSNFWQHSRKLNDGWYRGTTGLVPLDHVIDKANRIGWAHHIERLMIAGNLMLLAEIDPDDAYRWFMEMFVDSAEWVMVANVYAMALFADGGSITTKPYICGANYLRRMGDYPDGDWNTALDGLFWRFVAKHREVLEAQPRLGLLCRQLDRQTDKRRRQLQNAANQFLGNCTQTEAEVA